MTLIDTHCHIYLPEFKNDIDLVLQRAVAAGVEQMYLPGIDSTVINDMLALESSQPHRCFAMMGLHPCSVNQQFESEIFIIENWLQQRSFCAIGEIGLDYYWDTTFAAQQLQAFNIQMELALQYGLPVSIHTRSAIQPAIDAVKPFAARGLRGVFHCFGDTADIARQIISMGFYLGIGGVLTYKNAGLGPTIAEIPLQHIVLETDAPYLSPVPYRGKRNESSYLLPIAQKLADVKNISLAEVAAITTANAQNLFGQ